MTFEYIAGFFDGEGCVITLGAHRHLVGLAQRTPRVLHTIKAFLADHGIAAQIYESTDRRRAVHVQTYQLQITNMVSVERFLAAVVPHLIVKRNISARALKRTRERLTYWTQRNARYDKAIDYYKAGHSAQECGRDCGVNVNTLLARLKTRGVFRRGPQGSRRPSAQSRRMSVAEG